MNDWTAEAEAVFRLASVVGGGLATVWLVLRMLVRIQAVMAERVEVTLADALADGRRWRDELEVERAERARVSDELRLVRAEHSECHRRIRQLEELVGLRDKDD